MDSIIYILFVSISIPVLLMILLVEKKARLPILFMLIGISVSVFASEVNGLLSRLLPMTLYKLTIVVTPISEEILKALPVLYFAIIVSDKRETLFTASMATGIGFAILENAYYLINHTSFHLVDGMVRAFGAGLMHGMCTLLVGVGISFVKKKRKLFAVGTFGLLSTAITYHGIYNILIQSKFAMIGALVPITTYIPFFIWRMRLKQKKRENIPEEKGV